MLLFKDQVKIISGTFKCFKKKWRKKLEAQNRGIVNFPGKSLNALSTEIIGNRFEAI